MKVEQKQKHRLKVIHAHYRKIAIPFKKPTQSIYALSIADPSLFQSHQLFPNRIQNGYIFSYKEQAQSLRGGGGGLGGLYGEAPPEVSTRLLQASDI